MRRLSVFILSCFVTSAALAQQDTVIINNIKLYQEGKVNILKSPSGTKTVVTFSESESEQDEADTSLYWDQQKRKLKTDRHRVTNSLTLCFKTKKVTQGNHYSYTVTA